MSNIYIALPVFCAKTSGPQEATRWETERRKTVGTLESQACQQRLRRAPPGSPVQTEILWRLSERAQEVDQVLLVVLTQNKSEPILVEIAASNWTSDEPERFDFIGEHACGLSRLRPRRR